MYEENRRLEVPIEGTTYISKSPDNRYNKVKVLEHKEEVYKFSGSESPLSLVIFKVLEPQHARDNVDLEISDLFYDKYICENEKIKTIG